MPNYVVAFTWDESRWYSRPRFLRVDVRSLRDLPAILVGKKDDPHRFRDTFRSAFAHKLMEQVHEAFEIKSLGETDNLGHTFAPLSAKRLKQKSSPKFRARFPNSIPHAIMRVTDKMMDSYAAGTLSGSDYIPPKNQVAELRNDLIKIYSRVEYAEYQANRRPFWPDDISPWISAAIEAGLDALTQRMREVYE